MHILASIIFALTANIDNFTVGIAYGIKKIKIDTSSNLIIASVTGIGTLLSMSLGLIFSKFIGSFASNIIGSIILISIGIYFIWDSRPKKFIITQDVAATDNFSGYFQLLTSPEMADMDSSGHIDKREAITLAIALSLNNLGLGIGASISGLNIVIITAFTFIFSLFTISLGYQLGNCYLSKIFGKYTTLFSGIIILILGLYEMFI